jgi:hypothetical protein
MQKSPFGAAWTAKVVELPVFAGNRIGNFQICTSANKARA